MTKEKYQWYKSQGICTQCKTAHVENRVICKECQKKNSERKKASYHKRKEMNLCAKCGKVPPVEGKALCQDCLDAKAKMQRDERHMRKRMGYCVDCGTEKAMKGKTLCPMCSYIRKLWDNKPELTEEEKEQRSIADKKRYYERKEAGLCTNCGKRKPYRGLLCSKCYSTVLRRRQRTKSDITRSERPKYNMCYICGKEGLMEGKSVCESCYETRLKTLAPIMYMTKEEKNCKEFVR